MPALFSAGSRFTHSLRRVARTFGMYHDALVRAILLLKTKIILLTAPAKFAAHRETEVARRNRLMDRTTERSVYYGAVTSTSSKRIKPG
jgi:hypothetical protein